MSAHSEKPADRLVSAKGRHLDGALAHTGARRGFLHREVVNLEQLDHSSLPFGQTREGLADEVAAVALSRGRGRGAGGEVVGSRDLPARDPALPPVEVGHPVLADGVEPGAERPSGQVGMARAMDREQRLLQDVLDRLGAAHAPGQKAPQHGGRFGQERLVGGMVSLLRLGQKAGERAIAIRIHSP
jgi:hypothetical protein